MSNSDEPMLVIQLQKDVDRWQNKYPGETHEKKMDWGKVHLVEGCFRKCKIHIKELI